MKSLSHSLNFILALFFLVSVAYSQTCGGTSGAPDMCFGSSGELILHSPAKMNPYRMLIQSDNKIVALTGDNESSTPEIGYLLRYDADGKQPDQTFGSNGFVPLTWGGGGGRAFGLAKQTVTNTQNLPEERLVIAGWVPCGRKKCTRVERYTSAGVLDTTFGSQGVAVINNENSPLWITVLADQRLLLTGSVSGMIQLTANGSLDPTFGTNGISTAVSALYQDRGPAVVLSSGRFLIPGSISTKGSHDLAVARFNSNGSLDSGDRADSTPSDSFGTAGIARYHFATTPGYADALVIDGSGNIIVAGVRGSTSPAFTIRFNPNGQLDSQYQIMGISSLPMTYFSWIVLQNDGKAIVSGEGRSVAGSPSDALIARYNTDGSLDTSFGSSGWILKDYYGLYNWVESVLMQPDPSCPGCEKILVNGGAHLSENPTVEEVNFLRYLK